jgi:hypothetical protein
LGKKINERATSLKNRSEIQEIMKMVIERGKERTRDPTKATN